MEISQVLIAADDGTGMGMPAHPLGGWGCFKPDYHHSKRFTTMLKGIAIALFGLTILSQLDKAYSYGRYTEAALRFTRDIIHGFGF